MQSKTINTLKYFKIFEKSPMGELKFLSIDFAVYDIKINGFARPLTLGWNAAGCMYIIIELQFSVPRV